MTKLTEAELTEIREYWTEKTLQNIAYLPNAQARLQEDVPKLLDEVEGLRNAYKNAKRGREEWCQLAYKFHDERDEQKAKAERLEKEYNELYKSYKALSKSYANVTGSCGEASE